MTFVMPVRFNALAVEGFGFNRCRAQEIRAQPLNLPHSRSIFIRENPSHP